MWHVDLRLTHFSPGFLVPLSSYPALVAGVLLLFVSIYTLTITTLAYRTPCTFLRLALAFPTVLFFWNFGFGLSYDPPGAQVAVGMAVVGLYGIMRVLDTSVVSFLDVGPPLWVHTENGKPLPLPGTTKERLAYTFDLVTSLRGTSWFAGRHWEWAPTPLVRSPTVRLSRKTFLASGGPSLLGQYLLVDVLDSLNKSRSWDTTQRFPITSLSLPEQLVFSLSVCLGTVLSISVTYTLIASTAVALGSAPANWPPMFTAPFAACSLADFWARRWHAIFRRVFARLSLLSLALLPIPMSYTRTRAATRALTIFTLSAALHILLMYRLELKRPVHLSLAQTFLDRSILTFFLVQPIGLALEALVVVPLALVTFPTSAWWRSAVTRVWVWGFLLWTGRFWSDVWVRRGMWNAGEHVVGYSIVRGLLWGNWKA